MVIEVRIMVTWSRVGDREERHKGTFWDNENVLYLELRLVVTQVYVKIQAVHLRVVHFTAFMLYLNK